LWMRWTAEWGGKPASQSSAERFSQLIGL